MTAAKRKPAIKSLKPVERVITYQRVEVRGVVIEDDQLDFLEALDDADGLFTAIVPDDLDFAKRLEGIGLAKSNIRGGWYGTDELSAILPGIREVMYELVSK